MSEKKSLATEVYETVLDEMESMYETLLEAFTPPFGYRAAGVQEFIRNLPGMPLVLFEANIKRMSDSQLRALVSAFYLLSEEQRTVFIRQKGADWVLEALQKRETNEVRNG